jgi:hypothetical protein
MRNSSIPPNGHVSQGTSNFNPATSSQKDGHIISSQNIRGAISSSGSSYSTTSNYGGPGLAPSKVSMPPIHPTPMYSGSNALAPRGGLGNSGQMSSNGQRGTVPPSSLQPAPGSVRSPYDPHPAHPMNSNSQRGTVPPSSLQPAPGSVRSPYDPHPAHLMSSNSQRGRVPPSSLQPAPGSVPSPYGSAFKSYSESQTSPYGNRFKNPTSGYSKDD